MEEDRQQNKKTDEGISVCILSTCPARNATSLTPSESSLSPVNTIGSVLSMYGENSSPMIGGRKERNQRRPSREEGEGEEEREREEETRDERREGGRHRDTYI
jgi:hypothetical protein